MLVVVLMVLTMPVSAAGRENILLVGPGQEYATIQAAVDAAKQGGKILVFPGTYAESVSVTKNNLQIIAQGEDVIVAPPGGQPGFDVQADQVTVRGFEIAGAVCASGIRFQGSHNTFAGNWIHGFQGPCDPTGIHCVDTDGGSDHNTIEHNNVSGADGEGANYGIFVAAGAGALNRGNVIADNSIVQMDSVGVYVGNGTGFRVSGNFLEHMHTSDCILVEATGDPAQGGHRILENTMRGCAGHGILLSASPGTILAQNRISANWIEFCGQDCLALEAGNGASLSHSQVMSNTVSLSLASGIVLSAGQDGVVDENLILGNAVLGNLVDGISLSAGSDHNRILNNEVGESWKVGVAVAGDDNLIAHNWIGNNEQNLEDTGTGNRWRNNTLEE
jgi:parallel beta-helix repeat protein